MITSNPCLNSSCRGSGTRLLGLTWAFGWGLGQVPRSPHSPSWGRTVPARILHFLPQARQLRKARAVIAALIHNQPLRPFRRRVIVALDIEDSTSRPDPVKAELRTMIYELFDAALRSVGISARRRDRFADRGDGLLVLIDPADQALLLSVALPAFSRQLAAYNASLPDSGGRDRDSGSAS